MDSIGGMPVVAVCETPFYGVNGMVKRVSDIVLAALILLLISPVLLAIALGVKLTSPGPVLFQQRRYGLDGREIIVYKFRSMTRDRGRRRGEAGHEGRPARHAASAPSCAAPRSTSCRSSSTCCRGA